jgi:hypothetical protein
MPQTYKLLGQVNPTANTPANVYSVPASTEGIVNSIIISNLSSSNASFSLTVRPTSEALADKHFIVRGCVIPASDTLTMTLSLTMQTNAVLAANTNSSNLSISAHGVEIS